MTNNDKAKAKAKAEKSPDKDNLHVEEIACSAEFGNDGCKEPAEAEPGKNN